MAKQAQTKGNMKQREEMDIVVPPLGETVETALLARWLLKEGDLLEEGEALLELETDKISLEVPAAARGILRAPVPVGTEVKPGERLGRLDISAKALKAFEAAQQKSSDVLPPEAERQEEPSASKKTMASVTDNGEEERRLTLSPLRQAVARNLKEIQNQAAVLTTFTEIDMSGAMALRRRYQKEFTEKNDIKLGFMSFFAASVSRALSRFPVLNAYVDGDEAVYRRHVHLGIAVTTDKGLVVPVIREAEHLSFAVIEKQVADLAQRARQARLAREDLAGASFTITNGGIFGSLLSTPLLSPKQSGVLGLHAIKERPVAIDGQVVIRPMMYAALSYDHRLVDGKEAVSFLRTVKALVEDPARLLLDV